MKKTLSLLLFSFIISSLGYSCQQAETTSIPNSVEERIERVENGIDAEGKKWTIEDRMEALKTPGVSIAVIQDFKLDWAKGYGYANIENKTRVTPSTLFQAASISKSLAGVGVLKLAQDKKVKLHEDINTYLKSWKFPYDENSGGKIITLYNLLSHTAGTSVHGFRGYRNGTSIPTIVQILNGEQSANNEAVRSHFPAGEKVQYSGGGTTIAQLIVMDVTAKSFSTYMDDEVLQPLGMTSSFYHQPSASQANLATAYLADMTEVTGKYHIYPEQAAASLWTNPTDLSKYIIETQLALKGASSKVLTQENTRLRLTPYKNDAGLGVFITSMGNAKYFQHGGANEGFRALYVGDFEKGNGVAIMVNSENNTIIRELLLTVANVYRWDGYEDSGIKLSQAQLKSFEGYYQAAFDAGKYIEIRTKDSKLMLRQHWDGEEILFDAQSELEFLNRDINFPLKFSKNSNGQISEVLAFNRDVWKRDDSFVPQIRKPIELSPAQLKVFEGKFRHRADKNIEVKIVANKNHLSITQLWDGKEMIFVPETTSNFFMKDNPYRAIRFNKDSAGEFTELIAFGREHLDKVK
ncbi:MAG TPA: serine hydrolase domain-containing protein [Chryseosolibacter sp.]